MEAADAKSAVVELLAALSLRRGELCAVCYSIYNSCPVKLHFIVSTKMTLTLGPEQRPQKLIMK